MDADARGGAAGRGRASADTRELLLAFIAAYEALNATLRDKFEALYQRFGQDANEILGHLLLLETVVLRIDDRPMRSPRRPIRCTSGTTPATPRSSTPSATASTSATVR